MSTPQNKDGKTRVERFKSYVAALNTQFMQWSTTEITSKPDKFLTNGITDYLRHSAKLRREFEDVIQEQNEGANGASPGAGKDFKHSPILSLMPLCNTKTIHFIRHGEGFHNLGYGQNLDARLTEKGWDQAHALGRHMAGHEITRKVQVVIISPMMRALETAAGVFSVNNFRPPSPASAVASPTNAAVLNQNPQEQQQQQQTSPGVMGANGNIANNGNSNSNGASNGSDNRTNSSSTKLLMLAQTGEPIARAEHKEIHARASLQFVAHELCRERLGPSVCDKRRALTETALHFPGVDFTLVESNHDPSWVQGQPESESSVVARGQKFLQYLMSRPETNIAVVTHSAFLWFTLATYGNEYAKPVRDNLHRWYENCEMRSVVLSDGGGMGGSDKTWFKGGHAFNEPQQELMEEEKSLSNVVGEVGDSIMATDSVGS